MAIDTSIYNPLMRPVRSAAEYAADYGALEDQANARQVNRLQLQSARQAAADEQGLRNALSGGSDASPQGIINQLYSARTPVAIKRAMEMEKSLSDVEHVRAQTAQATATTGKLTTETQKTAWEQAQAEHKQAIRDLADQRSPADAIAGLQRGIQQGRINFMEAQPYMEQLQALQQSGNPAGFAQWQMGMLRKTLSSEDALNSQKLHFTTTNTGGKTILQGIDQYTGQPVATQTFTNTASPDAMLSATTTQRGQNMTDARARESNEIQKQGQRTQVIQDPERGMILVDKGTGLARPAVDLDGRPVQGGADAKRQAGAQRLLPLLDDAENLVNNATGSYLGAGADMLARSVGRSTEGSESIARLKVLEGQIMMNAPRMEGPQSDRDVQMYQQMAGAIGDPTVPSSQKIAALSEIRRINQRYAGASSAKPASRQPAAAPAAMGGSMLYFDSNGNPIRGQ